MSAHHGAAGSPARPGAPTKAPTLGAGGFSKIARRLQRDGTVGGSRGSQLLRRDSGSQRFRIAATHMFNDLPWEAPTRRKARLPDRNTTLEDVLIRREAPHPLHSWPHLPRSPLISPDLPSSPQISSASAASHSPEQFRGVDPKQGGLGAHGETAFLLCALKNQTEHRILVRFLLEHYLSDAKDQGECFRLRLIASDCV